MSKPQQKQKNSALAELIEEQKLLCEEFGSAYIAVSGDDVIAVAVQTLNKDPIVGLRKAPEGEEKVAWYIYGGELGEDEVSFETMPVRELQDILPNVLPYLALEQGYRFMIDADDYEDVWKEGDALKFMRMLSMAKILVSMLLGMQGLSVMAQGIQAQQLAL